MKRIVPFIFIFPFLCGAILGQHSNKDIKIALHRLIEKADSGDPRSLYELARLHDTGFDSIEKDTARSNALYILAAEKGYSAARNIVGFRYYNGEGLTQDVDSALYWIRLAAEEGDATAASNLGYLLSQSDKIPHDYTEAAKWLTKAAELKVPSALSQLGDLKRYGKGGVPDTIGAVSLYEEAAIQGDPDAQLKLLSMMGYKWKALEPDSALKLGLRYYIGNAPLAGVDLIEQAAVQKNPKALALLGDAYSKGLGVNYDYQKSIEYFYQAAIAGDPSAQFIIAELLEIFPDAVEESDASFWYSKAAEAGITDSKTAYDFLFALP